MQQPPPMRKGPYLKVLSNVHKEQIARLQAKNQHECDLLEDIKSFTKQRSAIEKSYAEALLKISNAYLNKKIPSIPDLRDDDGDEQWNVWNVWRTVLEENEKLGKARLAAVEVFQQQIMDDAKAIRQIKLSSCKKTLDQLSIIQKEVQYSVAELDRNKKLYFEEEHLAHDVRDKARDVEEKMKKKKGSIFSSLTALKRESVKVSSKKDACDEKSTGARNEYLIALAIANAHQDHYYNVDLDGTLKTLEADVYSKLKEYLTVLSRTELLTCSAAQNSFTKIRDQAQMLTREYNVMCCVQYYPVLKQHIRYPFDACDGDHCTKITCDHGAGSILSREAKRWATKIGKEVKTVRESQKKMTYHQQMKDAGNKADPDDPNGPDLDTKIEELREIIRRALTEKSKAEGVIECLRDGDVNVDEWMQDIESLTTHDMARSASATSIKTEDSRDQRPQIDAYYDSDANDGSENREGETSSAEPPERDEDIEGQIEMERKKIEALSAMTWDDPIAVDWGDSAAAEVVEEEPMATSPQQPDVNVTSDDRQQSYDGTEVAGIKCVAIYTYQAANPDELSIVENEHLELMGDGDEESGWVRARNYKGEEGYVPQNYVEVETEVDYHIQEKAVVPMVEQGKTGNAISNGYMDQNEDENQNLPQQEGTTPTVPTSISSGLTTPFINELRAGDGGEFCRALYDYEATAPEEISFPEGQIMKILRRDYDGWWEGEFDGMTGIFPEIVVEECRWDGEPLSPMDEDDEIDEDDVSDSGIQPPCYTPPIIPSHLLPSDEAVATDDANKQEIEQMEQDEPSQEIQQKVELDEMDEDDEQQVPPPIPETKVPSSSVVPTIEPTKDPVESSSSYSYGFEMELSGDRQQQYQHHFSELKEDDCPEIMVTEMPGIMVTMEPDEHEGEEGEEGDGSGLDVAQIVITAATPMTDDHVPLPGESGGSKKVDEEGDNEKEQADNIPEEDEQIDEVANQEEESHISEVDDSIQECTPAAVPPPPPPPPPIQVQKEESPEAEEDESGGGGWAAFDDNFPKEPQSAIPRVVEVEVKESGNIEPKKSSLEIDEKSDKSRISLGESNESPVTPEELDVQNLAKLESLKESDA